MLPDLTLAVVGADFPNPGKMPGRRFEIALCRPGDPVKLRREPKNPADPRAVAVYSGRDVKLGYVTAERAPLIGTRLADETVTVQAIFQGATEWGAVIRVTFDGNKPDLPPDIGGEDESQAGAGGGFYPDWIPPDD